jgi:magnesium transporter
MARRRSRRQRIKPPGTAPGTLIIDPDAPRPRITVIAYGPDAHVHRTLEHPDQVKPLLGPYPVVWINVDGLGDQATIVRIGELFDIHRLALEDVTHVSQRAKVEPYAQHLFVVARMPHLQEGGFSTEQVSFFLSHGSLVTFQEQVGDRFDLVRQRLATGRPKIRSSGADYLCYALIDALIDGYFPAVEAFGDRLEALEAQVTSNPRQSTVAAIHAVRRDLLALRRAIWPHREAISALLRDESPLMTPETRLYLRDCYDHCVQLVDIVETQREMAAGLTDLYLSSASHRMNEIMKVLTIFAAIFIPLTFIAGIYGMNFAHMPELGWRVGYPLALLLMAAVASAMLVFFRLRGWLGGRRAKDEDRASEQAASRNRGRT